MINHRILDLLYVGRDLCSLLLRQFPIFELFLLLFDVSAQYPADFNSIRIHEDRLHLIR